MKTKFMNQECVISQFLLADKDIATAPWNGSKFTGMACTKTQSIRGTHYHGYILDGIDEEGFFTDRHFDYLPGGPLYVGHALFQMDRAIVTTDTLLSLPHEPSITPSTDWTEQLQELHADLRAAFFEKWLMDGERGWQFDLDSRSKMKMSLKTKPSSYLYMDSGCVEVLSLLNKAAVFKNEQWIPVLSDKFRRILNEEPPLEFRVLFDGPNPVANGFMAVSSMMCGH